MNEVNESVISEKKIGVSVILNQVEQRLCKHVAKARLDNNNNDGIYNAKISDESDEYIDLEGFAGELAFCKIFNVFPDLEIFSRTSSEDFGDATYLNKQIDIKTTSHRHGRLIATRWTKNNVQAYALMVGEFPEYEFKGFMSKKEFIKEDRIDNLGKGKLYLAYQNELVEFDQLNI
jgi:hypothetical protein